jgi:acetyl esterase/lipase
MEIDRRQLIVGSAALTGLSVSPIKARPQGTYEVPLSMVRPELHAMVPQILQFSKSQPPMTRDSLIASQKLPPKPNPFTKTPNAVIPGETKMIPVVRGLPDVAIYVVNAKPGTARPAILPMHGGGYVMGAAHNDVNHLQLMCEKMDCFDITVDYRLALETTYQGSIEDNYAGLKWLHANADALGAAIVAITARDRGEVPVCFQCLIYPMLDDRTGSSVAKPQHVGTIIWTPAQNRVGWESFLGQKPGLDKAPVAAVPARNPNLKCLPPAFIGVGTLDLFCDEDIDYGQRLSAAGVFAETIVVPGAYHGFDEIALMSKVPLGTWFERTKMNAFRRAFGMAVV